MAGDLSLPCNIFWSDEDHFYPNGTVNTQNFRIWAKENPRIHTEILLHSLNVTVWCGFVETFILGIFIFEEITARGPFTYSVMCHCYHDVADVYCPANTAKAVLT